MPSRDQSNKWHMTVNMTLCHDPVWEVLGSPCRRDELNAFSLSSWAPAQLLKPNSAERCTLGRGLAGQVGDGRKGKDSKALLPSGSVSTSATQACTWEALLPMTQSLRHARKPNGTHQSVVVIWVSKLSVPSSMMESTIISVKENGREKMISVCLSVCWTLSFC